MTAIDYDQFLRDKATFDTACGFIVDSSEVHPILLPHQRDIVVWAVARGRAALFEDFGLGKTLQQLEVARLTLSRAGGRALIVCPLGVRGEFFTDAAKLSIEPTFVRRDTELDGDGIYLTNYESVRDGRLDPAQFTVVSLDEASVLRSFGSKIYQTFLTLFADVPYRFVATATPDPNRHKELIHYAGFLGVMDTGAALTRWFQRDSQKANNLTLYPHKEREFWLWLNTWATFLSRPSDLGYPDDGYDLPDLDTRWHEVAVDHTDTQVDRDGQAHLFRGAALGVTGTAREKRDTLDDRLTQLLALVDEHHAAAPDDQVVIWCDLNAEQDAIERGLSERSLTFSSVRGALPIEETERRLAAWRARETYALIGKPVMLGQGMNLQQACRALFVGVTFKFNDVIQACHRIHRFGQTRPCRVDLVHAESEREVVRSLREKWTRDREQRATMSAIVREHGLDIDSITAALLRSLGVERVEASGDGWTVARNDCVAETTGMDENSVDLIVTSVPFANHYEYTPALEDFGHTDDNSHFWAQMDYLTPQLLRVLRPGRIAAIHVKDRILFGAVTGAGVPTVSPFHAEAIAHFTRHGFDYLGMQIITTDVVRENAQTYRLGHSENAKDATKMGCGSPEFVLWMHKPQTDRTRGYADVPVQKSKDDYSRARWQTDAHAYWRDCGDRLLTPEEIAELPPEHAARVWAEQNRHAVHDHEAHVRTGELLDARGALPATWMALPVQSNHPAVWSDINRLETLNTEQSRRAQANHVCPLQFGIVDRIIVEKSNPGDLVYDPFGGLFTVALRAMRLGRAGRSVELNPDYFRDGVSYLRAQEQRAAMPTLFDVVDVATQEAS